MKNQTIDIAVCDDTQTDKEVVAQLTEEICKAEGMIPKITCFDRAETLLDTMQRGERFALLLIDVLMPGLDGMELARVLREKNEQVSIIFISSNREMALQGYEVSAARYLAKPVDKEKLKEAILFCYGQYQKERELLLPVSGSMRRVAPKDIYYAEIMGRKCRIRMEQEEYDASLSLSELEELLPEHEFIRCHQSFLVNWHHVQSLRTDALELTDKRMIPVSKHRVKQVRQAFVDYMKI